MANIQETAQQLTQALDKVMQAKNNPQELERAVNEAKNKGDQLAREAQTQPQSQGQPQEQGRGQR